MTVTSGPGASGPDGADGAAAESSPPAAPERLAPLSWRGALSGLVVLVLCALLFVTLYLPRQSSHSAALASSHPVQALTPSPTLDTSTRTGSVIDAVTRQVPLRASPNGKVIGSLAPRTSFGSPRIVAVVRAVPGWLGVIVPELHNGTIGWIPAQGSALARVPYSILVHTASHRVTVLLDGKPIRSIPAAVGRAQAATPPGQFAVTDKLRFRTPSAAYGCCALALSAHEYHILPGWTGGDLVAIHSTPDTASIGQSVSHGCVRVSLAQGRWLVDNIPTGTLVTVSTD